MFETPILFIVFNRPDVTVRVFKEIKKQKPKFLFIAADGPRVGFEDDIDKCRKVREIVLNSVDWDCEIKTLFRNKNLGCGKAVSGAIDWFFENVEMGIILEDDCLPNHSFFGFCKILLERYKHEDQVYAISGNNFQDGIQRGEASYYFSNYGFIWGWATWRRAWNRYDYKLKDLDKFKKQKLIKRIDKRRNFQSYWYQIFDEVYQNKIDTWDYQWLFAIWYNKGMVALPNVNLVSNIGFGEEATHTIDYTPLSKVPTKNVGLIRHPKNIEVNKKADKYLTEKVYGIIEQNNILIRRFIPDIIKKLIAKLLKITR
ncbi:hypothetical protein [Christiangramia forsetii]|uniref:Protein containing nucleotide-diphospho-sugar transferase domain n=2 Tax=Christiangramia forsetii TaxID=411153 RepID=A0LYT6_CHRFK|nr:hypothetical protein [Christiangramia forsetii]GGG33426.1 hemolytic protein HlpA [Christiangramia forsetii]CAL65531.1 protein containing nucleotide-diphospho-sugar transferase domain [Christiangramia forsetii KT0803]